MKQKKKMSMIIQLSILLLSLGFIVCKVINCKDMYLAIQHVLALDMLKIATILFVMVLMPINWGLEAIKWKFLMDKLQPLSFNNSLKGVFSGVTAAMFTPNRVGELGGRVYVLKKENRISGVFCTGIGSFSQLIVTVIAGLVSLSGFMFYFPHIAGKLGINGGLPIIITMLSSSFLLFAYLNFNTLCIGVSRLNWLKRIKKYFHVPILYTRKEMIAILGLSLARYVIFSFQFYILLYTFGVELSLVAGFGCIALTYLFSTFIPSIALAEFSTRGSAAIIFINFFSEETLGIISASVTLWMINLVIPALFGAIIFYKSKI